MLGCTYTIVSEGNQGVLSYHNDEGNEGILSHNNDDRLKDTSQI